MVTLADSSPSPKVESKQEEVAKDSNTVEENNCELGYVRPIHASASSLLYYYRRSRIVRSMVARKPQRLVLPEVKLMMSFHHIEYSQQTLFYSTEGYNFSLIVEKMKQSLSEVLVEFCPLESNVVIKGIDAGVDFIEATAQFTREDAVDSNDPSVLGQLIPSYDMLGGKDVGVEPRTTLPLLLVQEYNKDLQQRKIRAVPPLDTDFELVGFFDGAADNGRGGCGFILYLNRNHLFRGWSGLRSSTNNLAEIFAVWTLLHWARILNLNNLKIFGDSLLVINWLNGTSHILAKNLIHHCSNIRNLLALFEQVSFQHIFRQHNLIADSLSKKGLESPEGLLQIEEWENDHVKRFSTHRLFS